MQWYCHPGLVVGIHIMVVLMKIISSKQKQADRTLRVASVCLSYFKDDSTTSSLKGNI